MDSNLKMGVMRIREWFAQSLDVFQDGLFQQYAGSWASKRKRKGGWGVFWSILSFHLQMSTCAFGAHVFLYDIPAVRLCPLHHNVQNKFSFSLLQLLMNQYCTCDLLCFPVFAMTETTIIALKGFFRQCKLTMLRSAYFPH
jgi:hypothetical protein